MKKIQDHNRYTVQDLGWTTPCWIWSGNIDDGYGRVFIGRRHRRAHRVIYEQNVGPIPEGLTLDHLCRNKACVNPDHLEPVTVAENARRGRRDNPAVDKKRRAKTHCKHGHEFTPGNTYWNKHGFRQCKVCSAYHAARAQGRDAAR